MSKRRRNRQIKTSTPSVGNRSVPRAGIVLLALIVVGSVGYVLWAMNQTNTKSHAEAKSGPQPANPLADSGQPRPDFQKLKGRWLRPDGGYIVEVTKVSDNGAMEVSYYNPGPIHVSKSEASWDGTAMTVFIELRDTNYPGCTYRLVYLPASDELAGIYYQAAIQQEFEVVFERLK